MKPLNVDAGAAARLLKALANESRILILSELLDGERCVNELESVVGLSQSALSQHLALLRKDELVQTRREGKMICYSLNGRNVPIVLETLYRLFSIETPDDDLPPPPQPQGRATKASAKERSAPEPRKKRSRARARPETGSETTTLTRNPERPSAGVRRSG